MLQVLELPDDFYPTDMHWMPRGGGGASGTAELVQNEFRVKTSVSSGKKAAGGSDLFLLTSATGRLQLVCSTFSVIIVKVQRILILPTPSTSTPSPSS